MGESQPSKSQPLPPLPPPPLVYGLASPRCCAAEAWLLSFALRPFVAADLQLEVDGAQVFSYSQTHVFKEVNNEVLCVDYNKQGTNFATGGLLRVLPLVPLGWYAIIPLPGASARRPPPSRDLMHAGVTPQLEAPPVPSPCRSCAMPALCQMPLLSPQTIAVAPRRAGV